MEVFEDIHKLQNDAKEWLFHNTHVPDIVGYIRTGADPKAVNTWLPLIYVLIGNQGSLNCKGRYFNHRKENSYRKSVYDQLRTAVQYCPLPIFKYIIKYTAFNQNELKSLITPTIPIDKFAFLVCRYNIKLTPKALINKLSLAEIWQLYDLLLQYGYKKEIWSELYKLYKLRMEGDLNYNKFQIAVLKESIYFKYLERKMDKNLVFLILLY
jgi:hypothetical protein